MRLLRWWLGIDLYEAAGLFYWLNVTGLALFVVVAEVVAIRVVTHGDTRGLLAMLFLAALPRFVAWANSR
jgi:hypothetical protein